MSNNTLPEELKIAIKDKAEAYAGLMVWIDREGKEPQLFYEYISSQSYIAGATEYAQKYQQARGFLERLMNNHNATLPTEQLYNEIKSFLDGSKR